MTEIRLEHNNGCLDLTVMGHCNAGRINGTDLCCCAVSMLIFTVMEALGAMKLSGYKASYGGGWCHICFDENSEDYSDAMIAVDTVMKGFELLQGSYPASVCIAEAK